jgi:hypothetical protein
MKLYLIRNPLQLFLGGCALAWALGFIRYFGHWVYFPVFPNILDSLGMALVGTYLLYHALERPKAKDNAISRARFQMKDWAINLARFQFLTKKVQDGTATLNEEKEFITLRSEFFPEVAGDGRQLFALDLGGLLQLERVTG